jgi:DtxR family transcriptional regulator, Mn-dependent transcriptional regulator
VVSDAAEGYLKAIFALRAEQPPVTTTAIAERLGVAAPSVSGMLKRLEAEDLVRRSAGSIELTAAGERAALAVVRRHRLLETFLHRVLDVPWDEVHVEAERLEHAVSDALTDRIDRFLGAPTHDPHGDPIPQRDRRHDERRGADLRSAPAGSRFLVERVSDRDSAALRYLGELGIRPGVVATVVEHAPFGGPTWVEVDGHRHALGAPLAGVVWGSTVD